MKKKTKAKEPKKIDVDKALGVFRRSGLLTSIDQSPEDCSRYIRVLCKTTDSRGYLTYPLEIGRIQIESEDGDDVVDYDAVKEVADKGVLAKDIRKVCKG